MAFRVVKDVKADTIESFDSRGIALNNGGNFFTTRIAAAENLAENLTIRFPLDNGLSGNFLITDGSGNTSWAPGSGSGSVTEVDTGVGLIGGPITTTGTISLATSSAVPGLYGNPSHTPQIFVNPQGIITSANNVNIVIPLSGGTNVTGTLPIANGGTNSNVALTNDKIMVSSAGSIVESTSSLSAISNQLILGTGRTTTISAPTPAITATYTIPDVGPISDFVMTESSQNISGVKTFGDTININSDSGLELRETTNVFGTLIRPSSILASNTSIRLPANNGSPGFVLSTDGSGNTSWVTGSTGTVTSISTGTGLTGGPITTSGTISLANTTVVSGTYGTTTQIPQIAIDPQGRITSASNVTISGTSPGGAAGGDLTGTYPNPTVAAIRNTNVSALAPSANEVLAFLGGSWTPSSVTNAMLTNSSVTVTAGTGLTGGGAVSLGGSTTLNLANTTVTPNTYGASTIVPQITVDQQGRITNAADVTIVLPLNGGTNVTGVLPIANGGTNSNTALTGGKIMVSDAGKIVESTSSLVATSNQLILGTGNTITLSAPTPASSLTYTFPDVGTAANIVLSEGAQTINGVKSFGSKPVLLGNVGIQLNNLADTFSTILTAGTGLASNLTLKLPVTNGLAGNVLSTDGAGNTSWTAASTGTVTNIATGTGLTGGPITTTGTISLADTAVTIGSYGSATQVGTFTVDQQGRLTSASNVTISGTTPGGSAGGDLTGTYPNPTVAAIRGTGVSVTAPVANEVLAFVGGVWTPSSVTNAMLTNSSITITAGTGLSGGGAVSLGGSTALNLANTAVTPGAYTNANITVDAQGRLTSASSGSLSAPQLFALYSASFSVGGTNTIAYLPWQNSRLGSYTTRTVTLWAIPSTSATRSLTVNVRPNGGAAIGTISIPGGAAVGAIYTFTFTNPGINTVLFFEVVRVGPGGTNPIVQGIYVELS